MPQTLVNAQIALIRHDIKVSSTAKLQKHSYNVRFCNSTYVDGSAKLHESFWSKTALIQARSVFSLQLSRSQACGQLKNA